MRTAKEISIVVEKTVGQINKEKAYLVNGRISEICMENKISESHIRNVGHWHSLWREKL